jgi:hypothetical protein
MHRTLLVAGALTSALAVAAGAGAGAAAQGQKPSVRKDGVVRFTLVAPDTEQTNIDVGTQGPSQGDLFVFSGPLVDARGATRGRLDGSCVTVSVPDPDDREQDRRQCFVTSTLGTADGETEVQATGVGRILAEDVLLSVTGGTMQFKQVRGQALFDYSVQGQTTIGYELILRP